MIQILLVDDEREEREGIEYLIRTYQYPLGVHQAPNGKKALEYMECHPIDILFTDVKMPVMNGLDLAKEVSRRFPEVKIIIFSAYGEFDYAKQALQANAVNYLLKPIEVEEFRKVMETLLEEVESEKSRRARKQQEEWQNRKNIVCKFLTGAYIPASEKEYLDEYLFAGRNAYRLVYLAFAENFFEKWEELFAGLVRMYLGASTEYLNIFLDEGCLLIREKQYEDRELLESQLLKLSRDLVTYTKNDLFMIAGKMIHTIGELEAEARVIHEIQREVFGFGEQVIWTEQAVAQEYYSSEVEALRKQLVFAIEANRAEIIEKYAKQLLDAIVRNGRVSRLYVQNVFYTVFQAIYDRNPDIRHEKILSSADTMFYSGNSREMVEYFRDSIRRMLSEIQEKQQDDSTDIQKIKNLVEKEYMNEISLGYVADKVHLAPAYVSYIFKKETGQTLIKYITEIRMEKARLLLSEENWKIVQVAKACGYENQSYFNRAFKNYFGVTPSQFKEGSAI